MLDIKFIRENKAKVQETLKARGTEHIDLDYITKADDERKKLLQDVDSLRAERKKVAEQKNVERGKQIKEELSQKEEALRQRGEELEGLLLTLPNILNPEVPRGGESANQVIKKVGEVAKFAFKPKDHVEIAKELDLIDFPRAAKVSGARFYYLKNDAAMLEMALVTFAMRTLAREGFTPLLPPVLIRPEITKGLGYWQAGGNKNYYLVEDFLQNNDPNPMYLIGTAEHAVVPMHSGEVFEEKDLPKRYAAFSPSFRREAGTYGKDTHGILRVHQFEKVEMVSFVRPQDSKKEFENLLAFAESFVKSLDLPYQVVRLSSGDLSLPSAETVDIETWIPSQNKYRETHSISTTTDFQSRRFNIKYKSAGQSKFVHILNATALAIPRIIIAILENHQQEDGSIKLPAVLHDFMEKDTIQRTK